MGSDRCGKSLVSQMPWTSIGNLGDKCWKFISSSKCGKSIASDKCGKSLASDQLGESVASQ
jgi:hypothetical protein